MGNNNNRNDNQNNSVLGIDEDFAFEWIDIDLGELPVSKEEEKSPQIDDATEVTEPSEEVKESIPDDTAKADEVEKSEEAAAPKEETLVADSPADSDDVLSSGEDKATKKKHLVREIVSYLIIILIAVGAAFAINNYVVFNAEVPSSSMDPTISRGDRLMGYRLAYYFDEPERGEIIIFTHKCYETAGEETLIKRIVGMPGETVQIVDGVVYINGKALKERYIDEKPIGNFGPFEVPEGKYFVLGDNRNISNDSRYWDNKFIKFDEIVARAAFSYYPKFIRYNVD